MSRVTVSEPPARPRLILVGGEAWTGKTTVARLLLSSLDNAAWLDGDDVWRVHPGSVEDPRLRTSDVNMAFVVRTYLCAGFDHVILSSIVLSDQQITERILGLLREGELPEHDLVRLTLTADEATLRDRALARDGEADPQFRLRERAAALSGTVHVDTTGRSPEEVLAQLLAELAQRS